MGNNPSRPPPGHSQHGQQTPSSSGSTLTAFAAPRSAASNRRHIYRRNSLQHPPNAPSNQPTASLHPDVRPGHPEYRYTPPLRRESLAEGVLPSSSYNHSAIPPTKEELLEDAATLRQFPTPPTPKSAAAPATMTFAEIDFGGGRSAAATSNRPTPSAFSQPFATAAPKPVGDIPGQKGRRGSMESTVSMGEPDISAAPDARAIPTLVTWPEDGDKVYLTGTFCGWEKRYRLSRHSDNDVMSAVVPIPPGTHHVKFLVDGEMRTSSALPTAVDDTGILVNYLEVSADELPPLDRQMSRDYPETTGHAGHGAEGVPSLFGVVSSKRYTTEIPAYLREYMEGADDDEDGGPLDGGPPPPSLPMMLQKVILNTSTQMKDDASVLTIPNHAVLNHLATSSIKNHILAVSATTRYKKKYVTTILYKAAGGA